MRSDGIDFHIYQKATFRGAHKVDRLDMNQVSANAAALANSLALNQVSKPLSQI